MTLQTKLSLSVATAVALSILLTLILTWRQVSTVTITKEEEHFASLGKTIEQNLEATFHEYLAARVRIVLATKELLRSSSTDAKHDIAVIEHHIPPSPEQNTLRLELLSNHTNTQQISQSPPCELFLSTTTDLITHGLPALHIPPQAYDAYDFYLGDTVALIPAKGSFSIITTNQSNNPILLFMLPIEPGSIDESQTIVYDRLIVAGTPLRSLFKEAEELLRERIDTAKINFENITFYDQGCLLLKSNTGEDLIDRGESAAIRDLLPDLCGMAKEDDNVTEHVQTEAGTYLCHVAWIQCYDYYLIMAVPIDVLRATTKELIKRLIVTSVACLLLACLSTLWMLIQSLRPFGVLVACTKEMAGLNPSVSTELDAMETMVSERLDVHRHDELGDLARSFAAMSKELANNIRTSLEVMTAQKRLEGELSAARDIQMSILPTLDDSSTEENFAVAAFLEPALEVGGDLYDCFPIEDGRKAIVIGDVSGKGVPASLFMTMSVTLIRFALRSTPSPAQAMTHVNTLLEEHNSGSMFVTLFIGLFDPQTGDLHYANGGHCLPYILAQDGSIRQLENLSGPLVGAMPGLVYTDFHDTLQIGDRCFLYTDGLTEAMNANKDLFGDANVAASLTKHATLSPSLLEKAVFEDICQFRGTEPPSDDITMLTIARL
ncbi:MAG: SpoIIE family protein phosphatase [Desulfovibrio sp.]|nr:SpoIIE family protein phosphatase [Desulfovibrio sp.]